MCGRFTLFSDGAELARLFGCGFELPLEARYNIAPSQEVPGRDIDVLGHSSLHAAALVPQPRGVAGSYRLSSSDAAGQRR
jgi:hypothetical protein